MLAAVGAMSGGFTLKAFLSASTAAPSAFFGSLSVPTPSSSDSAEKDWSDLPLGSAVEPQDTGECVMQASAMPKKD